MFQKNQSINISFPNKTGKEKAKKMMYKLKSLEPDKSMSQIFVELLETYFRVNKIEVK